MIRPLEQKDIPRVAEIHVFGWRSAYRGIVSDQYLFNSMLVVDRVSTWQERLDDKRYEQQEGKTFVYDDGTIKGFLTINKCRDEDKPDAFELCGIYIEPLMKRQGIGRQFVQFCEDKATQQGHTEICLWVFEKNSESRKFYEKMGYVADGAKKLLEKHNAYAVRYCKKINP